MSNNKMTIANLDIDSWIGKSDEEIDSLESEGNDEDESTLKYSTKIVAFLDLLGITNSVRTLKNGRESDIIKKMTSIKNIVEYELEHIHEDITMLHISDSFIFVSDTDILGHMLKVLATIQTRVLIEEHTMLRGAVECGDVIVKDEGKQIIGPAYIDAYENQEHNAIYPRIILGQSIIKMLSKEEKLVNSNDGQCSLDYLDIYMEMSEQSKTKIKTKLRREKVYSYLNDEYEKNHIDDKISVYTKYAWTINYLKEKGLWNDGK